MKYLLDTNIISEPARIAPSAAVLTRLEKHTGVMALSAVTWFELCHGVNRLSTGRRRAWLEAFLSDVVAPGFPVVAYDVAAATWHARERARCAGDGFAPALADSMIAATAAVHGLTLVTRNTRDFVVFDGLAVENWFE